jgi:glycosyltransferase involved in cell wall biosynthesis
MEQTLGHVTHSQNLRTALGRRTEISATWMPIGYEVRGLERFVPAFAGNWSVRASLRARNRLARELAHRRHDVLFFHTQVTALFSTSLMHRVPAVVSLDATPINYDSLGAAYRHRPAGGSWLDAKKYRMNKEAFGAARALVAWSEWAAASLVADYGVPRDRITVVAPGAAQLYFRIGEARRPSTDSSRPVRLLFVGGDFARKGGYELLEAVTDARTARPFELHIVTRDAVAPIPRVFVHNGVRPNSTELFKFFREADVFVLPSHGECLSVALMEASAARLPLISTPVGALGEAAIHGQTALVVPPGDAGSLRGAIEALVDDEALRWRLGDGAHALARVKFDADRNNEVLLDLLTAVARPAVAGSAA